jgi:hypothetical protein
MWGKRPWSRWKRSRRKNTCLGEEKEEKNILDRGEDQERAVIAETRGIHYFGRETRKRR